MSGHCLCAIAVVQPGVGHREMRVFDGHSAGIVFREGDGSTNRNFPGLQHT